MRYHSAAKRNICLGHVCLGTIAFYLVLWVWLAAEQVSFVSIAFIISFVITAFGAGTLTVRGLSVRSVTPISLIFVIGGLVAACGLYFLRVATPMGLELSYLVVFSCVVILMLVPSLSSNATLNKVPRCTAIELLATIYAGAATTIWCQDLFRPFIVDGVNSFSIVAWQDIFYHLSQIANLGLYDPEFKLSDVQHAFSRPSLYHYGSYMPAAIYSALTESQPLIAYTAVYVPLGLLFVYLTGFSLVYVFFGSWPALVSLSVLAAIPDPSFYGLSNWFFGYNWLQQIAPSGAYGVACAGVALFYLLVACAKQRWAIFGIGLLFVLVTAFFKVQIFVPLLMVSLFFPILFFGELSGWIRGLLGLVLIVAIFIVSLLSERISMLPSLQLDGSALIWYRSLLLEYTASGVLKTGFLVLLGDLTTSEVWQYLTFAFFVYWTTFGVVGIALFAGLILARGTVIKAVSFAPFLVAVVYLALASFITLEKNKMGMPEEFLHRHFVWAYFVVTLFSVASCSRGLLAKRFSRSRSSPSPIVKCAILATSAVFLFWPVHFSSGIQAAPVGNAPYPKLSGCVIAAAEYLRANADRADIIQDTKNNLDFRWSGLTGLRAYVTDSRGFRVPEDTERVLKQLTDQEASSAKYISYLRALGVDWLITYKPTGADAFKCGDVFVARL